MKIIWLPRAIRHRDNIYKYYYKKSPQAAIKLYNDLLDSVNPLKDYPNMAAIEPLVSDSSDTYHSLVVRDNYKVVYYIDNDVIYISAVWDCRQNPKKLKDKIRR